MVSYLISEVDCFLSDVLKREMARIKEGKPFELLSTERYNLPAPTPGLRHDPEAWIHSGYGLFLLMKKTKKYFINIFFLLISVGHSRNRF